VGEKSPDKSTLYNNNYYSRILFTLNGNPGHLASRGGSCRDAGQHGANLGHPGKSVMGGNQRSSTSNYVNCDVISAKVLVISINTIAILN